MLLTDPDDTFMLKRNKNRDHRKSNVPVDFFVVNDDHKGCYGDKIEEAVTCHWVPRQLHRLQIYALIAVYNIMMLSGRCESTKSVLIEMNITKP